MLLMIDIVLVLLNIFFVGIVFLNLFIERFRFCSLEKFVKYLGIVLERLFLDRLRNLRLVNFFIFGIELINELFCS